MLLEHHAGVAPVSSDIAVAGECPDSVDENTPARRRHEAIKCAQERGFSRPGCAEKDGEDAGLEYQIGGGKPARAVGLDDFKVFNMDHRQLTSRALTGRALGAADDGTTTV